MTHFRRIAITTFTVALLGHGVAFAQRKPATASPGAAPGEKKIYCWNEGVRKVCGDALPASASNSARTEISSRSGLTTGRMDRALTGSERSAAEVAAEVARKQAEALALQQRRDLAMVESYMTEADLRRAYGERTILLDETLKASKLGLSNLRLSLLALLRQAGDRELGGEPVGKRFIEWNFVSSSKDRLEQAKADWRAGRMKLPDADDQEFIPLAPDPPPPANPMS